MKESRLAQRPKNGRLEKQESGIGTGTGVGTGTGTGIGTGTGTGAGTRTSCFRNFLRGPFC